MDITSYLLGKNSGGGGGTPKLQDKTVTITENTTTTIIPDEGYDGLGTVEIITNVSAGGLPDTFQAVSYIQSSGTQYIDTGVKANSELNITITVNHFFNSTEGSKCLYSGGVAWQNKYLQGELDSYPYFAFNNQTKGQQFSSTVGTNYTVNQNKNVITINDNPFYTFTYGSFSTDYNLVLFAANHSGTIEEFGTYRIKSCQIKDNGVLVRNFVPCYRKSDNVIGLYDIVGNNFYTNAGTGSFTKGGDV